MFFTDGDHMAFESLMRDRPGHDHYDSGAAGRLPECRNCRFHRPRKKGKKGRTCHYDKCPYSPDRVTATAKGNPHRGGDAVP